MALIKVKNMPSGVAEACRERGFDDDAELSPEGAMREWAGWHLGDPTWASTIIDYYDDLQGLAANQGEEACG